MIHTVRIKGFKRFEEAELKLPEHVVLAGPNNTGKTTILQAIASWALALRCWRNLNDFNPRREYVYAPIARQVFSSVPLKSFEMLWWSRWSNRHRAEVEIQHNDGWSIAMEFLPSSTEQIYVRPRKDADSEILRGLDFPVVFIPPMTGIGIDEPVLQPPKIEQLLGLGRPGEVLRNLLAEAHNSEEAWGRIQESLAKLFGYELLPPDTSGANIRAEYTIAKEDDAKTGKSLRLDIASAGSGFLQVLMLLAFINTKSGTVLLLDEPDAHLHIILQDAVYHELRTAAARQRSQLIVATHSEIVINAVDPRELYVTLDKPRKIVDNQDKSVAISSLRVLSNSDIMQASGVRGILYVEDYTDKSILRAWAGCLQHPAEILLTTGLMWKPAVFQAREGGIGVRGIKAQDHYEALRLVRDGLPGLALIDGDAHEGFQDKEITGTGLQRLRWRRYEIESYLLHPDSLARFVESVVGKKLAKQHIEDMATYMRNEFPPAVTENPLGDHEFLRSAKARKHILPPLLEAAGIQNLSYTRYHEIASLMKPKEIHPEVVEKLDAICRAFGVET